MTIFSVSMNFTANGKPQPQSIIVNKGYRVFQAIARTGDCQYSTRRHTMIDGKRVWIVTFKSDVEKQVYAAAHAYARKHGIDRNIFSAVVGVVNDPEHPYNVRSKLSGGGMFV